jgi:methionyl-tRNA synthetase
MDEQRAEAPANQPTATAGGATATQPAVGPGADERIGIEDFLKIDLRVARVVAAERVPKSRKLVKMDVDLGSERRTLVAGIGEAYDPDSLVGRLVGVVANLKPATLMGVESNGMVLAASVQGGLPVLVAFDKDLPPGARIK